MRKHFASSEGPGKSEAPRCAAYRTTTSWLVFERGWDKCRCGRTVKLRLHRPRNEGDWPEVTYPAHKSGPK